MRIFSRLLAAAVISTAAITSSVSAGTVAVFGDRFNLNTINNFYDGLADHSSSIIASLSDATLSGVDLLWAVQPADSYSAGELNAMSNYIAGGGRIAFMGEHGSFLPNENNRINAALASLGSTMSIVNQTIDTGFRFATRGDGQILDDPLLDGVNTYEYAAFAPLEMGANGKALMLGEALDTVMMGFENVGPGSIFLITDQNVWDRVGQPQNDNATMFENLIDGETGAPPAVPLPAAGWMLIAGLGGLGALRKFRKS